MASAVEEILLERIRTGGPITVADLMEVALYHPEHGYYRTAPRRSGRDGDFYTSVDVGPMFGEMIAVQIAEMCEALDRSTTAEMELVESGASDGRLMRDILDALSQNFPAVYKRVRVTLVERSAAARQAQTQTLAPHRERLAGLREELPVGMTGIILANELLDALPIHVVQFGEHDVQEVYVTETDGTLTETVGPLSDERIARWLALYHPSPKAGTRGEVSLSAIDWIQGAGVALERGFLLLFDYACEAGELNSEVRPAGTLVAYRKHTLDSLKWLNAPGESDLTSHVNLGAVREAAASAGLALLGTIDQSYFLMNLGLVETLAADQSVPAIRRRLAARSLIMPGGLGSTMKVMGFVKGIDRPTLRGFSAGRLT